MTESTSKRVTVPAIANVTAPSSTHMTTEQTQQPLVEFLLARYDEDEADLEDATHWQPHYGGHRFELTHDGFMADPNHVRADLAAKRQIVEENRDYLNVWSADFGEAPTYTLRHLASVYADHPDYREEWQA